jgi:hypothetical protein
VTPYLITPASLEIKPRSMPRLIQRWSQPHTLPAAMLEVSNGFQA